MCLQTLFPRALTTRWGLSRRVKSRAITVSALSGRMATVAPFIHSTRWKSCLKSLSDSLLCLLGIVANRSSHRCFVALHD